MGVIPSFWLLRIKLYKNSSIAFYVNISLNFSGINTQGCNTRLYGSCVFSFQRNSFNSFPERSYHLTFPPGICKQLSFSLSLSALVLLSFFFFFFKNDHTLVHQGVHTLHQKRLSFSCQGCRLQPNMKNQGEIFYSRQYFFLY